MIITCGLLVGVDLVKGSPSADEVTADMKDPKVVVGITGSVGLSSFSLFTKEIVCFLAGALGST